MARPIKLGINIHTKPWTSTEGYVWNNIPKIIDAVAYHGFDAIRVDCGPSSFPTISPTPQEMINTTMGLCRDRNIKVQIVFTLPFGSNRTDKGAFADTAAGRYQQGYTLVKNCLQQMPYLPEEVELENEIPIKALMLWNAGQTMAEYNTTAFIEWAEILKGEYDAVREVSPNTKIIVGTTNRNYAFIPWLINRGINMDMVGFHIYFRPGNEDTLDNWQGGGSWHNVMQAYNKPITVNELNGNSSTGVNMGTWGRKALQEVASSKANIHSVFAYELLDTSYESGFGILGSDFTRKSSFTLFTDLFKR